MEKNKPENKKNNKELLGVFKRYFFWIVLFIFVVMVAIVGVLQYKKKMKKTVESQQVVNHLDSDIASQENAPDDIKQKIEALNKKNLELMSHLNLLEKQIKGIHIAKLNPTSSIIRKLIVIQLSESILKGHASLKTLKGALSNMPDTWAKEFLSSINNIQQVSSDAELERMLLSKVSDKPIWWSIKQKLNAFIKIRKISKHDIDEDQIIREMQTTFHTHQLKLALELFKKLPADEQKILKVLKNAIQLRITFEDTLYKLLETLDKENY